MYCDINNKEARHYVMVITIISDNIQANKNIKIEDSRDKAENNQPLLQNTNTPLKSERFNQDPHRCGIVMKLEVTPKEIGTKSYELTNFFSGEKMCKVQTGE